LEFYKKRIIDYKLYILRSENYVAIDYINLLEKDCYFDLSMLMDIEKSIRKDLKKLIKNQI